MSQGESAVHAQEIVQSSGGVGIDGEGTCCDVEIGGYQSGKTRTDDDDSR